VINKFFKIILAYNNLPLSEKKKVINIVYLVVKMIFFVSFIPLRIYYKKFSFGPTKNETDLQPYYQDICRINKVCNFLPFKVSCIVRSMVTHDYLKKRSVYVAITLGVKRNGGLQAHAWILPKQSQGFISLYR
jgi:hypothetical protein